MSLFWEERKSIIDYLLSVTDYESEVFDRKTDKQLYGMFMRIKKDIPRYIEDILRFQKDKIGLTVHYKREDLQKMTYNELALIRKNLKPTKKKVVAEDVAPQFTIDQGGSLRANISPVDIMNANEDHDEVHFYTVEEIELMYGEDLGGFTEEELFKNGIKIEEGSGCESVGKLRKLRREIKEEIILVILNRFKYLGYRKEELKEMDLCSLRMLYERL